MFSLNRPSNVEKFVFTSSLNNIRKIISRVACHIDYSNWLGYVKRKLVLNYSEYFPSIPQGVDTLANPPMPLV